MHCIIIPLRSQINKDFIIIIYQGLFQSFDILSCYKSHWVKLIIDHQEFPIKYLIFNKMYDSILYKNNKKINQISFINSNRTIEF